ncbi:MAG TPA: DNA repair protein RadA [Bdellovibrionales bacterium]|nr:DNA repair protein RadA [Thioclava sp.]HAG92071.1 DNA repair protein RadA [Bdellovibrionales bacterium]
MAKSKTVYVCQSCGAKRPRWEGRCSDCNSWNSFVEETPLTTSKSKRTAWVKESAGTPQTWPINDVPKIAKADRMNTGLPELDRVLGGGVVYGSYTLIGGDPGIGKSTIVMQMAGGLAKQGSKVLYVSAEESVQQTSLRAARLGVSDPKVQVASESCLESILNIALKDTPDVLIIDSIQTVYTEEIESAPGSVSQVRECAAKLLNLAKTNNICVFLIGHVTKEGNLAGPRVLEHMVDTVLSFEGDGHHQFRLLRAIKNRFGATNELGVFQMAEVGLVEVANPSQFFLEERRDALIGSSVFSAIEGSRPLLCEIQALTNNSPLPSPRRTTLGIDTNRLHMLLAVLEKHSQCSFLNKDVYANVVGGLRVTEPSVDLALVAALLSAARNIPLPGQTLFFGEVGLTGEVRASSHGLERMREGRKLGFETVYAPKSNSKHLKSADMKGLKVIWVDNVGALEKSLFQGAPVRSKRTASPRRETPSQSIFPD